MTTTSLQPDIAELEIYPSEDGRALEVYLPWQDVGVWIASLIGDIGVWKQRNLMFQWVAYVYADGSFHHAEDIAGYLAESWRQAMGITQMPFDPPIVPPEPAPDPEIKSGIKTVAEMADLMEIDRDELQRRLDARTYDYKFKVYPYFERDATGQKLNLTRNEYSFDKKQAAHNVKNRDIVKEVKQKK